MSKTRRLRLVKIVTNKDLLGLNISPRVPKGYPSVQWSYQWAKCLVKCDLTDSRRPRIFYRGHRLTSPAVPWYNDQQQQEQQHQQQQHYNQQQENGSIAVVWNMRWRNELPKCNIVIIGYAGSEDVKSVRVKNSENKYNQTKTKIALKSAGLTGLL